MVISKSPVPKWPICLTSRMKVLSISTSSESRFKYIRIRLLMLELFWFTLNQNDLLKVLIVLHFMQCLWFKQNMKCSNQLRQTLHERGAEAVIPTKSNWKIHIPHDEEAYKRRHLIENYFSKIKEFRGVNTRYDKTDSSYEATWNIAATIIALRWMSTSSSKMNLLCVC